MHNTSCIRSPPLQFFPCSQQNGTIDNIMHTCMSALHITRMPVCFCAIFSHFRLPSSPLLFSSYFPCLSLSENSFSIKMFPSYRSTPCASHHPRLQIRNGCKNARRMLNFIIVKIDLLQGLILPPSSKLPIQVFGTLLFHLLSYR